MIADGSSSAINNKHALRKYKSRSGRGAAAG